MTSASCGRSNARRARSSCRRVSPTSAGRDIALPIGCGQTSPPPSIVAAMIAALEFKPEHRVCEIGTGTGYCAALLAQLANTVVSLERFQTLAVEASARIKAFGLANVTVHWADGFEHHASGERFDRVLVHGLIEPPGEAFRRADPPGGVLVAVVAGPDRGEQRIVRLTDAPPIGAGEAAGPRSGARPCGRSNAASRGRSEAHARHSTARIST